LIIKVSSDNLGPVILFVRTVLIIAVRPVLG